MDGWMDRLQILAKIFAGKSIPEMTYIVTSLILSINSSILRAVCLRNWRSALAPTGRQPLRLWCYIMVVTSLK